MSERNPSRETRASLLLRLRDPQDQTAWSEFHDLYAQLIYSYARARGLQHRDAEEVRSDCYAVLVKQMPDFEYDPTKGRFKAYLQTIVTRRIVDRLRKKQELRADTSTLANLADKASTIDDVWESQWRQQHLRFCVADAKQQVNESTWEIFRLLTEEQLTVEQVGEQLSISANQIYKARGRMLDRIRAKMKQLSDA